MEFILNECSLIGQYSSMKEFVEELGNVVGCINIIRKNPVNTISKVTNFYEFKITQKEYMYDLKKLISNDDSLISFQLTLDKEVYDRPHWDDECLQNLESSYWWNEQEISATGMAEAAASSSQLLSFNCKGLVDEKIEIQEIPQKGRKKLFNVQSIFSVKYLIETYGSQLGIGRDDILKERYRGTRIDYSTIEEKFGVEELEEIEYLSVRRTLDKVVQHESFITIEQDDGLKYKKYKPSQKEKNWFSSAKYRNKCIMKMRCSDVMRIFGYRKGEQFKVLRIERDHKISDNG